MLHTILAWVVTHPHLAVGIAVMTLAFLTAYWPKPRNMY